MTELAQKKARGKRTRGIAVACLLAGLAVLAAGLALFSRPLAPLPPNADLLEGTKALDSIVISARFSPGERTLTVEQRFQLQNRADSSRTTAVFRAYPNAFQQEETSPAAIEELYDVSYPKGFSVGALVVNKVWADMQDSTFHAMDYRYLDDAKTVLQVTLPREWQPETDLFIGFSYTVHIPALAGRFGEHNDFWALGNAFLIPAPYENGAYRVDAYYPLGDPFVSDSFKYSVSLELPDGYRAAASGWKFAEDEKTEGGKRLDYEGLGLRDFAFCISPNYQVVRAMEEGVLVSVYAADRAQAKKLLGYARKALAVFSRRYGAYPYPALTLAEADAPFGGMEYPCLTLLGSADMAAGGENLEWLVAHEIAHQWWYNVVGSDQVNQPWQDEGLCEYGVLSYAEDVYGMARREELRFARVESAMRVTVPRGVTPGSPLTYFGDGAEYSLMVYSRSAALFVALNEALGGKLDDFLRRYYDKYRFSRATREDFEAELKAFSGEDWSPLMMDYLDTYLVN